MKKYLSLLSIPALMTLNSCLQEDIVKNSGEEITAKVNITLPGNGVQSRAVTGPETDYSSMRLYLAIYYGDDIVKTIDKTEVNFSGTVTEDIRLVAGKTYKIAAWADFGENYYIIKDGTVALQDTEVTGNDSKNDAFYAFDEDVTLDATNTTVSLNLKRPFGLVQVTTNDWADVVGTKPTSYSTTMNVPTQLDLTTGTVSNPNNVTFSGTITDGKAATQLLSYDYILAGETKSPLKTFTVTYSNGTETDDITYEFNNIPVQRNYITKISGNVLTKSADLNISIDKAWADTELGNTDVSASELQNELNKITSGTEAVNATINLTEAISGEFTLPGLNGMSTLTINLKGTTGDVTFKEGTSQFNGTIILTNTATETTNLTVTVPNGDATIEAGKWGIITSTTRPSTLRIESGVTINSIQVAGGNVDIYQGATVTTISRTDDNKDTETKVNLFDGATAPSFSDNKIITNEAKSGQIVNVNSGKSYATVGDAIAAANSNDKIELAAATFDEVINIAKSDKVLTIVGQEGTKVKSCYINGGNTTFENIEFYGEGMSAGSYSTVFAGSSATLTLKNCVIDVTEQLGTENQGRPVETAINAAVNFTMEGCTIKANNAKNVYLNPVAKNGSLTVKNCTFVDKGLTAEFNIDANSAKVLPVLEGNDFGGNTVGFSYYADPKITDASELDFATKMLCNNILENNTFTGENKIKVTPLPWASDVYFWVNESFKFTSGDSDNLRYVAANGGEITLNSDCLFNDAFIVNPGEGKTVTINLNGKTIKSLNSNNDAIKVDSGTLIINGEGNVGGEEGYYAVWAINNSKVILNGGNYYGNGSCIQAKDNATVEINGGYYKVGQAFNGVYFVINLQDNQPNTAIIKGGKFENFNPADTNTEPAGVSDNFVAEGYESTQISTDPIIYEVTPIQ